MGALYPAAFDGTYENTDEINIFNNTFSIIFQNVHITSDEFVEISFSDFENFEEWENVTFDESNIRVVLEDEETEKFLTCIKFT